MPTTSSAMGAGAWTWSRRWKGCGIVQIGEVLRIVIRGCKLVPKNDDALLRQKLATIVFDRLLSGRSYGAEPGQ